MFKSMKLEINGVVYPVAIEKKKTTKNTYIRVKEDLTIYVTTNILTRNSSINKIIDENYKAICKMIEKQKTFDPIEISKFAQSVCSKQVVASKIIQVYQSILTENDSISTK